MDTDEMILGNRIKHFRTLHKLTLEQLSEKAEISLNYIQTIESGKEIPSIELFLRIVDVLEVQPHQLLSDSEPTNIEEVEDYCHLSLPDIRLITATISAIATELFAEQATIKQNVGKRLHEGRKSKQISMKSLAREIGISGAQLGRIESGSKFTTLKTLATAVRVLELPIESLLRDEGVSSNLYILNETMTDLKSKLTTTQYAALKAVVESLLVLIKELDTQNGSE